MTLASRKYLYRFYANTAKLITPQNGVDPDAPHQMLPVKCSPKNAKFSSEKISPCQNALHQNAPRQNAL